MMFESVSVKCNPTRGYADMKQRMPIASSAQAAGSSSDMKPENGYQETRVENVSGGKRCVRCLM